MRSSKGQDKEVMYRHKRVIAIAMQNEDKTFDIFLKNGGTLFCAKVTGERRYSYDLYKGDMELPADSRFMSSNPKLLEQMQEKNGRCS